MPHEANSQQDTQCSSLHNLHIARLSVYIDKVSPMLPSLIDLLLWHEKVTVCQTLRQQPQVKTAQAVLSVS